MRDELLNDDDALFNELISRFGTSDEEESSTGDDTTAGDVVDPCA